MPAFTDLVVTLAADPRVRGRQFEHICRWYLMNDPQYRTALRHVWLWDDWPGRWSADAGIDLVAEDHSGRLWAIQAKAYAPQYTVTKADVDTFLAESSRAVFSYRLLIATTDKLSPNGRRTIDAQEKAIGLVGLSDLLTADVNWPANPGRLRPSPPPKPAKPRDYQREAIDAVVTGFDTADRGQMIMACGTGKTLTAQFIAQELDAQRTLVLVPSLSLLKQTMRVWQTPGRRGVEALPVCSDETVSRTEDIPVEHVSELGLPVTTDPAEIAAFLRKRSGPRVVFCTYQSSQRIAEAFALSRVPAFDLVVADEAHRCAGQLSSDFSAVLDSDRIRARRRLFMTATPRFFTGRVIKAAGEADLEVASMDDETKFGRVFHRLGYSEAIRRELLTDYQVAIIGVDNATYRAYADKGTLVTRDGKTITDARSLAGQIGLAKAMRKYDLRRVISFHSRVARAREFTTQMPAVIDWMPARQRPTGGLWSRYASGAMSAGERHVLLQHLSRLDDGERGLLANARCLAEGVDVPTLDGIAFIDPRRSEVDIVQAVGRAIRKADHKVVGTIVIPVFIDTDEDPEIALDDSAFKPVWDVIKALRSHDEELGHQLDELRRQLGRHPGRVKSPGKIHLDLPTKVGKEFADAFDVRLVERTTASWEFWFGLVEQFAADNGHARVASKYATTDGYRLGAWVANQRTHYAKGALGPERMELLEAVPGWTWDPIADYWVDQWAEQWERGFRQLQRYVDREGDARVPSGFHTSDGYKLGWWVIWQRDLYGKGELDQDRRRRLQKLPGWSWDPRTDQWEQAFRYLQRFVEETGHARVPRGYKLDGFNLATWVRVQRREFTRDTLSAERRSRLEALPQWSWDPFTDKWEEGFRRLTEYVDCNGNARVPRAYIADRYNLGAWLKKQRAKFNRGLLEPDRVRRLEELPGWSWDPLNDQWEQGFGRLVDYVDQHGDALVPNTYVVNGFNLASWVKVQRRSYATGRLSADRQRRLEELAGWKWETLADKWEEGFRQLCKYVNVHGDARVPRFLVTADGYRLGAWINQQRNAFKAGTLRADREERLRELPDWTFDTRADQWDEGHRHLAEYLSSVGGADVPSSYISPDGYRLGQWVGSQRGAHAKGTLPKDREKLLTALSGWSWNSKVDRWDLYYSLLRQYVRDHNNARIPHDYEVGGYKLGSWVASQRLYYKRGVLAGERIAKLGDVPGWSFDPFAEQWEEAFAKLVAYANDKGDAAVPYSYVVDGIALGTWVRKQRAIFNRGGGDPARRRRLHTVKGWTWTSPRGSGPRTQPRGR